MYLYGLKIGTQPSIKKAPVFLALVRARNICLSFVKNKEIHSFTWSLSKILPKLQTRISRKSNYPTVLSIAQLKPTAQEDDSVLYCERK